MSWRGSFITNYIYCDRDFELLKDYFEKRFPAVVTIGDTCGIIAGHTRDTCVNDSMNDFTYKFKKDIEGMIRVPLAIAVITDDVWGDVLDYTPTCQEYLDDVKRKKESEERTRRREMEERAERDHLELERRKLAVPKEVSKEQYEKTQSEYDSTFLIDIFDEKQIKED